jgi:hypothetical protein
VRRLASHLFTFVSALSLLLFVAVGVLWARSLGHFGKSYLIGREYTIEFVGVDGVCGIQLARDSPLRSPTGEDRMYGWFAWRRPLPIGRDRTTLSTPSFDRRGFGFHALRTVGRPQGNWRFGGRKLRIVYAPFWVPIALLLLPPLLWGAARTRRALLRRGRCWSGRCLACGYDLRAGPDRCPACGTVPPAQATT